jgi:FkbM family methyltransferase
MTKLLFPRYLLRSLQAVPHLGLIGALKLLLHRYVGGVFTLRCRTIPTVLDLRGKTSDLSVTYTIVCHRDYDFPEVQDVDYILDCGGYIGVSILHLKNTLAAKKAIAVEPNLENFGLLARNCNSDDSIRCIHGAIWNDKKALFIANPSAEKFAFQCSESASDAAATMIEAHTMSELLENFEDGRILVKMDIEGAEKQIFSADTQWLGAIDYLIMEIHPGCWKTVFDALTGYDYDCRFSGENILFIFKR